VHHHFDSAFYLQTITSAYRKPIRYRYRLFISNSNIQYRYSTGTGTQVLPVLQSRSRTRFGRSRNEECPWATPQKRGRFVAFLKNFCRRWSWKFFLFDLTFSKPERHFWAETTKSAFLKPEPKNRAAQQHWIPALRTGIAKYFRAKVENLDWRKRCTGDGVMCGTRTSEAA